MSCISKSHNFGIFLKKGKRGVLQLDFPSKLILVIQRGHIKKSLQFHSLLFFDAEDDLHISCRFLDGDFEFDADTSEEKYTICRLLDLIVEAENAAESLNSDDDAEPEMPGLTAATNSRTFVPNTILKEGILEKKGNTTITIWNKRKVKVSPGEFAYYKPGDDLALNVVHLRLDKCRLQRVGHQSLYLIVNERTYCFRVPNYVCRGQSVETVREDWLKAFEKSMTMKRALTFSMSRPLPMLSSLVSLAEHSDAGTLSDVMSDVSSTVSSPVVPRKLSTGSSNISIEKVSRSDSLTDDPAVKALTAKVTRQEVIASIGTSNNQGRQRPGEEPPPPPYPRSASLQDSRTVPLKDNQSIPKGIGKQLLNNGAGIPTSASACLDAAGQGTSTAIGQAGSEQAVLRHKSSSMSDLVDTGSGSSNSKDAVAATKSKGGKPGAKEGKNKMTAIAPPTPPPPPPGGAPTAPLPPPPPPTGKGGGGWLSRGTVKLKQVHWTPVDKKQVSHSLWAEVKVELPTFDCQLLESMFALSGNVKNLSATAKTREAKKTLVDAKRAQNLGIVFSGFRQDSLSQLHDALSSVHELETFQLQKMTTLKRFQPTADDVELFRMYGDRRETLEPVDRFMLELCEIPKLGVRIDLVLALWDLPNQYQAQLEVVEDLLTACERLISSTSLPVILHCLLTLGNHLNASRSSKNVPGFQISSVDKMVDLKGRDPQSSLLTFLVDQLQLTRSDLLAWTQGLTDIVHKVAGYSVKAVTAEVEVLKNDVHKIKKHHKNLMKGVPGIPKKFHSDVQNFALEYEKRVATIQNHCHRLNNSFSKLLTWLGEPPSRTSDVLFSSLALLMDRFQAARARLANS